MPDFFGKSGTAWAGTQFLARVETGAELVAFYYDGFTDDKKEDSFSALSFLEVVQSHFFVDVYPTLFPEHNGKPIFYTVFLDGAGCYVSLENLLTRISFAARTHIYMKAMFIPEAYYNKTSLDGHFATAGKQMRAAVATGQTDAYDAASMMKARTNELAFGRGATNHVVHFQPNRDRQCTVKKLSTFKIKSFSERRVQWVPNTPANRLAIKRMELESEIDKCTVTTLKDRLLSKGLRADGMKSILAHRLKDAIVCDLVQDSLPDAAPLLFESLTVRRHSGVGVGESIPFSTVNSWWDGPQQITTHVQVVGAPTACAGRNTDQVVSADSTRPTTRPKGSYVERKAKQRTAEVADKQMQMEAIKSASKGFWCPRCSRFFMYRKALETHQTKNQCQGGSVMFRRSTTPQDRLVNRGDIIKRVVAQKMGSIIVAERGGTVPVRTYEGRVTLPDGSLWCVKVPVQGYATKKRESPKSLTKAQLRCVCGCVHACACLCVMHDCCVFTVTWRWHTVLEIPN